MKIKGNVVVLTNGKLNTKSAKTAHGLIRGSKRFNVVAVEQHLQDLVLNQFHQDYV